MTEQDKTQNNPPHQVQNKKSEQSWLGRNFRSIFKKVKMRYQTTAFANKIVQWNKYRDIAYELTFFQMSLASNPERSSMIMNSQLIRGGILIMGTLLVYKFKLYSLWKLIMVAGMGLCCMYVNKSIMHKKVIQNLMRQNTISGQEARIQFRFWFDTDPRLAIFQNMCYEYKKKSGTLVKRIEEAKQEKITPQVQIKKKDLQFIQRLKDMSENK